MPWKGGWWLVLAPWLQTFGNTSHFSLKSFPQTFYRDVFYQVHMISIIAFVYYLYGMSLFFPTDCMQNQKSFEAIAVDLGNFTRFGDYRCGAQNSAEGKIVTWGWVPWRFTVVLEWGNNGLNEIRQFTFELKWWNRFEKYCKGLKEWDRVAGLIREGICHTAC